MNMHLDYSNKKMDFKEGVIFMKALSRKDMPVQEHFIYGEFTISYPGYKHEGDYRLSYTGTNQAPKHTDIIDIIYAITTDANKEQIATELDAIYKQGLKADTVILDEKMRNKIYWITLQEEINYPQPGFKGNRLPFQRFFEATLVPGNLLTLEELYQRTNNHGKKVPQLLPVEKLSYVPAFYYL